MRELSVNERRIIELIATSGTIARVDLARQSGLTGASVTRIIAALADLELLEENADKAGAPGQPKRMLSIKQGSYFAVGITFTLKTLELAVIDATGTIVETRRFAVGDGGATGMADAARARISDVLRDSNIPENRIIGLGCAMPGNFGDTDATLYAHEAFAELDDKQVLAEFAKQLGLPFSMENDGTTAALGEFLFGRLAQDGTSPYLIHLGHGVGGGVITKGRPFVGAHGNAGLPGFLFPYGAPRPSALDLLETLQSQGHPFEDFSDIEAIAPDDPVLAEWCGRAGVQLRDAVRAATALLDPSVIVIGGRLPVFILDRLAQAILAEPIPSPSRGLRIAPVRASTLGPAGGAIGAASLPLFSSLYTGGRRDFGNPYLNGRSNLNLPEQGV